VRRALVVAYYFPPLGGGGVGRSLKLVRALVRDGWSVSVLGVDDAAWTRDESLCAEVPDAVSVLRLPNPDWGRIARRTPRAAPLAPGAGRGRLARWLVPDLHVGWSALAAGAATLFAAAGAVDVVYTSAPPYSAHAAGLAARLAGVPWVADFRDAWTDNYDRQDLPRWRRRLEAGLERAVLRRADRVIFASEGARARAIARLPELALRSETVHSGFDREAFADAVRAPGARAGAAPVLELVHAGSVLLDRKSETLDVLLASLRAWAAREPAVPDTVRIRFVGAEPAAAARLSASGLGPWVGAEPALPRRALPARLAAADACLHLAPPGALGGDPIPGKLFDAVGARRTVVSIARPGAVTRLVRERGLGVAVAPEPEAVVRALERLRRARLAGEALPRASDAAREALCSARTLPRLVAALEAAAGARGREVAWRSTSPS